MVHLDIGVDAGYVPISLQPILKSGEPMGYWPPGTHVEWSSSDPNVAGIMHPTVKVQAEGSALASNSVIPVSPGTTTICAKARLKDGRTYHAVATVTVKPTQLPDAPAIAYATILFP
jgi:hypothetical protein